MQQLGRRPEAARPKFGMPTKEVNTRQSHRQPVVSRVNREMQVVCTCMGERDLLLGLVSRSPLSLACTCNLAPENAALHGPQESLSVHTRHFGTRPLRRKRGASRYHSPSAHPHRSSPWRRALLRVPVVVTDTRLSNGETMHNGKVSKGLPQSQSRNRVQSLSRGCSALESQSGANTSAC